MYRKQRSHLASAGTPGQQCCPKHAPDLVRKRIAVPGLDLFDSPLEQSEQDRECAVGDLLGRLDVRPVDVVTQCYGVTFSLHACCRVWNGMTTSPVRRQAGKPSPGGNWTGVQSTMASGAALYISRHRMDIPGQGPEIVMRKP